MQMRWLNKIILKSILVAYFLMLGYFGWFFGWSFIVIRKDVRHSDQQRVQLLYRTDHVALLAACREVMTNRHTFTRDRSWHGPGNSDESFIDPEDTRVPAVISALHPSDIIVSDSNVQLELHGGFDHYGVIALSEEAVRNQTNDFSGLLELIPGLWYCDDGLAQRGTVWIKKLKGMKPHDAAEPKW